MPPNGAWSDLLDLWLDYTSVSQSPEQFRLWSGLSMIAGSLEKRVWAQSGQYQTFPNLYLMLVGRPGIGKQVVDEAREITSSLKLPGTQKQASFISSDSATRASLTDELSKSLKTFLPPSGPPLSYHYLNVINEEFQVLLPAYDREFVSRLNRIYMNPPSHEESRRTGMVRELRIEQPSLNLLVATQPSYLSDTFPENAWATGLARRLIMIYASTGPLISIFTEPPNRLALKNEILYRLTFLHNMYGHARWQSSAAGLVKEFEMEYRKWLEGDRAAKTRWPVPTHTRLDIYNQSRTMFLIKLSMICAVSATAQLLIREEDVLRALSYLLEAESRMPDIFREMRGQSDREVMEELHRYASGRFKLNQKLQTSELVDFLSFRVPSDKVPRILHIVEQSNLIARLAGTEDRWIPKPIYTVKGVE